jgi:hypothetical protein
MFDFLKRKTKTMSDEDLALSIAGKIENNAVNLVNVCRGDQNPLIDVVKSGDAAGIEKILKKIGKNSPEVMAALLKLSYEYRNTTSTTHHK